MRTDRAASADEWRRGWKLVLACFVGFSFFSLMSSTIGVFMVPIGREFGWSRTLLSAGVAVASVTAALLSPFFGVLIDRYGSRRVALPGLIATIVAISSFALTNGSPVQWLALWTFYAVISIAVKTTVWTAAVAGTFRSAQGLAMGLTLSGIAAAQAVAPPLATLLIAEYGWRATYVWLGCCWGGLTLLLCYLFLFDARDRAARSRAAGADAAPPSVLSGLTLKQALRSRAMRRIAMATLIMITATIGLLIHQIEILIAAGLTALNAAWIASLAGLAGISGKLLTGYLLDRYRAAWIGGATLALTAIGFALLLVSWPTTGPIVLAMVICGYAAGTALQIGSYLTARHAGLRHFGAIYGVITSLVALGSGIGPLLAGLSFDLAGTYAPYLIAGATGSLVSGLLIWTLPDAPDWEADTEVASRTVLPGTPAVA